VALTAQQLADLRWFAGYSVAGDSAAQPYREVAYTNVTLGGLSIEYRLAHLSAEEEARITGYWLPNLTARQAEIQAAAASLDTAQAAVWTRNVREMAERRRLFDDLRRDLCAYLGLPPGSALARLNRVVRA
jgi:hypothetical protein